MSREPSVDYYLSTILPVTRRALFQPTVQTEEHITHISRWFEQAYIDMCVIIVLVLLVISVCVSFSCIFFFFFFLQE